MTVVITSTTSSQKDMDHAVAVLLSVKAPEVG